MTMSTKTSPRRAARQSARQVVKAPSHHEITRGDLTQVMTSTEYARYEGAQVPVTHRAAHERARHLLGR